MLENEGFAAIDIDRVVGQYQQVNLAPTNDRSVLGSLGQIAYLDGLARCDLRAIDQEGSVLARMYAAGHTAGSSVRYRLSRNYTDSRSRCGFFRRHYPSHPLTRY